MDPDDLPEPGSVIREERTFTGEDVRAFADVSGDRGEHHERPDDQGRLLVHGLLTATLPTKIGGDLDVLARTMEFEFRRPVYTGQRIVCEVTVEDVTRREDRADVEASVSCRRVDAETDVADGDTTLGDTTADGELVMTGRFEGVVME